MLLMFGMFFLVVLGPINFCHSNPGATPSIDMTLCVSFHIKRYIFPTSHDKLPGSTATGRIGTSSLLPSPLDCSLSARFGFGEKVNGSVDD
jgi:hypothetical protein